ncbi:Protein-tyrosine sulfotransferase 2 [Amphibalanus amphitrite]|uniref:Protein-tyrosine sulfotransferase n=1 Tax=Amphibalanus amphitrite TaxID=1232801 RepID=A0A6A4W9D1_AMPAM|nr:Protein-tyrosine sulfotransferase 2 [Amphibalanus amphitrite]
MARSARRVVLVLCGVVLTVLVLLQLTSRSALPCTTIPGGRTSGVPLKEVRMAGVGPVDRNMPLIFIGGVPRSGTTLARAMLDAHPIVRCGEETRVIPRILSLRSHWKKSAKETLRLNEAGLTDQVTITGFDLTSPRQCLRRWNTVVDTMDQQCEELGDQWCLRVPYELLVLEPRRVEKSSDQVVRPVNTDALTKWVGWYAEDVVRDMAQLAPMLETLGYDPEANPPNYRQLQTDRGHEFDEDQDGDEEDAEEEGS